MSTTLTETQGITLVRYTSAATPGSWLPGGLAATIIADHVRTQLRAMRAEMLRR